MYRVGNHAQHIVKGKPNNQFGSLVTIFVFALVCRYLRLCWPPEGVPLETDFDSFINVFRVRLALHQQPFGFEVGDRPYIVTA